MEKIVFTLPSIKTGGGNRVILELANQLILKDISVDIVYPNNSSDINTFEVSKKVNFINIGVNAISKIDKLKNLFFTFSYLSKNYKHETIILTDPIMSLFIPMIRNNNLYRFIQADDYRIFDDLLVLKNKFFLAIYKILTKLSYQYKVRYLFNSKYTYKKFIEVAKRDIEYKLIHPSLNHKVFFNKNIRKNTEINICLVARKHPWKGFIDFIKPFNKGKILGIDNIFVISHDDLSDFDLSNVTLIKPKNDEEIAYYMNISHIFILTSWWEGFGLPPLEAMACGCAVILTNAGGVNEYAVSNENCLMYEPKDQGQLITHIDTLVNNLKLRNKLSENAIAKSKTFSWEKSTNQFMDILNDTN